MTERHNTTLHAAVREYLLEGRARQFTAPTIDHYRRCLSAFTRWAAEHDAVPLSDGRLSRSGVRRILEQLGKAAGVHGVHPHKLRRTFAVTCLRAGMDVYTLARLMGHSDIGTLRVYVASIGDALQQAHGNVSPVDRMLKR